MTLVKKQSLVDQIYDEIKKSIIYLEYPLGERLNNSDLQAKYQVSNTPVREAINRLQKEGLVKYENNVGARIISISEKDVHEISQLAMTLNQAAVKFSMEIGNHKQMAEEIEKYINDYKNAKSPEFRTKSFHNAVGVFYKYCGNERLTANMKIIQGQQIILRNIYNKSINLQDSSIDDLKAIHSAVLSGDSDKVIEALKNNEAKAIPVIINSINNKL